mgnify:CR=1 FL=1
MLLLVLKIVVTKKAKCDIKYVRTIVSAKHYLIIGRFELTY